MRAIRQGPGDGAGGWRAEHGSVATEYAVLLGLVVLTAVAGVAVLGGWVRTALAGNGPDGGPGQVAPPPGGGGPPADPGDLKWENLNGAWELADGVLSSNDPDALAVAKVPYNNYVFAATMQTREVLGPNPWDVTRLLFHLQGEDNYYAVVPRTDGVLELGRMQEGNWRPWLAYANAGLDPTVPHRYEVTTRGARIRVAVDGVTYIEYKSPDPDLGGGVGVANSQSRGSISDIQVTRN